MTSPEKALDAYSRLKDVVRFELERDCLIVRMTYLIR